MKTRFLLVNIYLIRGHHSKEYQLDEIAQRETWARSTGTTDRVFWLYGDESLTDSIELDQRIYVPCVDNMNSMLQKVLLGLKYCINVYNPEFVVLTTTNTFWNIRKARKCLAEIRKSRISFAGYLTKWRWDDTPTIKTGDLYVSGRSMIFHRDALQSLNFMNVEDYEGPYDDAAISHYLMSKRIMPKNIKRNDFSSNHLFFPHSHIVVKGVLRRQDNRDRMHEIDMFFRKKGLKKIFSYVTVHIREMRRVDGIKLVKLPNWIRREFSRIIGTREAGKSIISSRKQ